MYRSLLSGLLLAVLPLASVFEPAAIASPAKPVARLPASAKVAAVPVKIDWFYPRGFNRATSGKLPVVLILHGSGGLDGAGGFFEEIAQSIVDAGGADSHSNRVCGVVHYMDSTGHKTATSEDMSKYFGVWLATVQRTVESVKHEPFVDSSHITLLGHSLGAQLALECAARDAGVHSVVDMAGCFVLPTDKVRSMPPVLVLHGRLDFVVPLKREEALIAVLQRVHGKYEEHIYPRVDHAFNGLPFETLTTCINGFLKKY